jgi:hypothetical protein
MATSTPGSKKPAWLITFIIYNNNAIDEEYKNDKKYVSLERQKNTLFNAIDSLDFRDDVKIVLVEARLNFKDKVAIWAVAKDKHKRFRKERLPNPTVPGNTTGMPAPNAVLTSQSHFANILSNVKENADADRNIVITVGHGSIFGINLYSEKKEDHTEKYAEVKIAIQKQLFELNEMQLSDLSNEKTADKLIPQGEKEIHEYDFTMRSSLFSTEIDHDKKHLLPLPPTALLTVIEIKAAIKQVFDKKLDILVMDNCLMQNIFCQYELSDCVEYLVAAQSGISYPGFNYAGVIKKIYDNTSISTEAVAHEFVDEDSIRNHIKYPLYSFDVEKGWCLNAAKLDSEKYLAIKENFTALLQEMYIISASADNRIKVEIFKIVNDTNNQLFPYNYHSLPAVKIIDLRIFLSYFKQKVNNNKVLAAVNTELVKALDKLIADIDAVQIKSFIGKNFYPTNCYYADMDNPKGIGVGFLLPVTKTRDSFVDRVFQLPPAVDYIPGFIDGTRMIDFVKNLWDWYPRCFL